MDQKAKEKVLQKAYDLGFKYEEDYGGCGQVVVAALQDAFDMPNPDVFKSMSGYAGGGATVGDAGCGAYVGGILWLSLLKGRERDNFKDPERVRFEAFANARKLHRKFVDEFGTVICREMQMKLFGRPYYLPDADEMKKFLDAGGHTTHCPDVCGRAARWAGEIAIDEGLIPESKIEELAKKY
jgi:C_GCAxxG_C_C family probable redox protein